MPVIKQGTALPCDDAQLKVFEQVGFDISRRSTIQWIAQVKITEDNLGELQ
jgi:hypothetical protein